MVLLRQPTGGERPRVLMQVSRRLGGGMALGRERKRVCWWQLGSGKGRRQSDRGADDGAPPSTLALLPDEGLRFSTSGWMGV